MRSRKGGKLHDTEPLRRLAFEGDRLTKESQIWRLALGSCRAEWVVRPDGRFAWNNDAGELWKHACRRTGKGPVVHLQGLRSNNLPQFVQDHGFSLGTFADEATAGLQQLLSWISQRPGISDAVEFCRLAEQQESAFHDTSLAPVGRLYFFKLRDGRCPMQQEPDPGSGRHYGYHATSMYCLHRAVGNRCLNPGPGQLGATRGTPCVWYHLLQHARLCWKSYNHYVGLQGGPFLFAPVLLLEVVGNDDRGIYNNRKSTVCGQHCTYEGLHEIVGFYVHVMHIAELRYGVDASFHAMCEACWKGVLELPVNISWEELQERSYTNRAVQFLRGPKIFGPIAFNSRCCF